MKHSILIIALCIGAAMSMVYAQTPPKSVTSAPIVATSEQQEMIKAAAEAEGVAGLQLQVAQANLQAAQSKTREVIYKAMSELQLNPKQYGWKLNEKGQLVFIKTEQAK